MKTEAYEHADARRKNIPTSEDHVYMGDEERTGEPFSPSPVGSQGPVLLSWQRGKNVREIQTDALPLYIHEKVSPAAFVKQLSEPTEEQGTEGDLFDRFNGFAPEAKYDWYHHEGNWSNRMIRGNSVDVMASLAVKEKLAGQVQMVFFDPPYGISFDSNYQPSTRKRDGSAPIEAAPRRAFRDTYINGLHSYLDTIFSVAVHARTLLTESGSFFLQMGTENVHRLCIVLDEVFGAENRIATIAFAKSGATSAKHLPQVADWLLWYAKDREHVRYRQLYESLTRKEKLAYMSSYAMVELQDGSCRDLTRAERENPDENLPECARLFRRMPLTSQHESATGRSDPFPWNETLYHCPPGRQWTVEHPEGLDALADRGRLIATDGGELSWKRYENEIPGRRIHNLWPEPQSPSDMHYVVETAEATVERCVLMTTDPGDLVFDPTCGSGTSALVAERWGRRWITTDTSAIPIALCRQRVLSAVHKWYLTLDDAEGQARESELAGAKVKTSGQSGSNPASGFVYERVPYVSAAHLAYNEPQKSTLLFDRPLVRKGVRRISSPFTVESHSPWTYVSPSAPEGDAHASERDLGIRENVMKALESGGIPIPSSTPGRWHFDGIEAWVDGSTNIGITHSATLRSSGERIALAMVPDDRAASAAMVDRMAIYAARNGFDKLVVIAFHFEPGVDREKRGKLEILTVRANRDLTVSELAASRADNAFVLVGEPDVEIKQLEDGRYQARIEGYQVYDPGLGNVHPTGKASDIDCWMMDTNYDGKSFFARRIHFPDKASDKQIGRFLRELSRRIDPKQWQYMTSLTSAPFERPSTGRIAVRIVTQFGDEMLTVLPVETE